MKATIAPKKWIFKATQAEKWGWRDTEYLYPEVMKAKLRY